MNIDRKQVIEWLRENNTTWSEVVSKRLSSNFANWEWFGRVLVSKTGETISENDVFAGPPPPLPGEITPPITREWLLNYLSNYAWPSVYDPIHPELPDEVERSGWAWVVRGEVYIVTNIGYVVICKEDVHPSVTRKTAPDFLEAGVGHMRDRAAQRDSATGERSMKATVDAFNALYDTQLTETQGWQFMVLLKMSRARTGVFNPDDYEDQAAYAALAGESAQ